MSSACVSRQVVAEKAKDNDGAVSSLLSPRIALLKDNKVTQDQSKAGDTIRGLRELEERCPAVLPSRV